MNQEPPRIKQYLGLASAEQGDQTGWRTPRPWRALWVDVLSGYVGALVCMTLLWLGYRAFGHEMRPGILSKTLTFGSIFALVQLVGQGIAIWRQRRNR